MSNLLERLRSAANSNELRHEAADEIERLCAEVADLTGANVLLHGIVSNREEEISGLRAQLASASERAAEMQYEAGMYHSLYDVATERLASARKALTMFVERVERYGNWDDGCFYYGATSASELQEPLALSKAALTDDLRETK